jgi:hypothetical protein
VTAIIIDIYQISYRKKSVKTRLLPRLIALSVFPVVLQQILDQRGNNQNDDDPDDNTHAAAPSYLLMIIRHGARSARRPG